MDIQIPHEVVRAWGTVFTGWSAFFSAAFFMAWCWSIEEGHAKSSIRVAWIASSISSSLATATIGTLTWLYW